MDVHNAGSNDDGLDHRAILTQMERTERAVRAFLGAAALLEVTLLVALLWLVDFGDRLHQVLLVMTFLIYGTLALALFAHAAQTRLWMLRVLKAIELLASPTGDRGK